MTLQDMPIEDLEVLYKEIHALATDIEYPYGTVDVQEVWDLYFKVEKTLEARKKNISEVPDKESLVGHCFIFHIDYGYAACKIISIEDSSNIYCDCLSYNGEDIAGKYQIHYNYADLYSDGFELRITKDNRLNVMFHDDYDGSCFAKEISAEEYEQLINTPIGKLEGAFAKLGVNDIDIY